MRTSCISHPANTPLLVMHPWQIEFCEGSTSAAALLSFFEYWHNFKLAVYERTKKESDLLQHQTYDQLVEGVLHLCKRRSISKALSILKEKGAIETFRNPKNPTDQTSFYLFKPNTINSWLKNKNVRKLTESACGQVCGKPVDNFSETQKKESQENQTLNKMDDTESRINKDSANMPYGQGKNALSSLYRDYNTEITKHNMRDDLKQKKEKLETIEEKNCGKDNASEKAEAEKVEEQAKAHFEENKLNPDSKLDTKHPDWMRFRAMLVNHFGYSVNTVTQPRMIQIMTKWAEAGYELEDVKKAIQALLEAYKLKNGGLKPYSPAYFERGVIDWIQNGQSSKLDEKDKPTHASQQPYKPATDLKVTKKEDSLRFLKKIKESIPRHITEGAKNACSEA